MLSICHEQAWRRGGGRLIAQGTLDELRGQAGQSAVSLEDTFLALVADEAEVAAGRRTANFEAVEAPKK